MRQEIREDHRTDADGNPTGGFTQGTGIDIKWQDGPLGRDEDKTEPNGASVEDVIRAAMGRLEFFQSAADGRFACDENAEALRHLAEALGLLNERTADREARQVEGTYRP